MPDNHATAISESPASNPGQATTRKTTWGEILVCGLILGLTLYVALFSVLLADALFLNSNLIIKPIRNAPPAVRTFIEVIYYPEIVLLKFFRVVPN